MRQYHFLKLLCITVGTCVTMFFTACTGNFEYYNTHPYNPTKLPVDALFETMLYQMHHNQENDSQMVDQMVGDQYGGYTTTPTRWQGTNFSTYNQPENWNQMPFNTPFNKFYANWHKVKEVSEEGDFEFAWANLLRVAAMLRITDTYGPIPYSKMGFGQFNVAYDSVEDVYKNMLDDLDKSIDIMAAFWAENRGKNISIADADIVYNGDFGKWVTFGRSLKLRMAIRLSDVAPEYAKAVGEAAVAAGVITTNADIAQLPSTDNPYAKSANSWGDLRLSADLDSYMNGYADPRLSHYATVYTGTTYRGVRMGINIVDGSKDEYASYSRPRFSATSPLPVMNAAEVAFIKAEGALRGWNMGGTAQSFYEQGIRLSMEQYGISATNITSYIGDNTRRPANYTGPNSETSCTALGNITIQWDESAAFEIKLERIITQKWLANFMIGLEAWCDYRRTGYPRLFPTVNNLSGGVIDDLRGVRRLKFPLSEYTGNSANVQEAIQMIGGTDSPAVDLWWAKQN